MSSPDQSYARDTSGGSASAGTATGQRPSDGQRPAGGRPGQQARGGSGAPRGAKRPAVSTTRSPVPGQARRVRLTVARIDPWSVMKLSFLLSVAIGIALVVAAGVLWTILDGMGLFSDVNGVVREVLADPSFEIADYVGFGKVISLATVIAVVDVVLLTAIATLGAFLYNIASTLVGGLHVTLSDD